MEGKLLTHTNIKQNLEIFLFQDFYDIYELVQRSAEAPGQTYSLRIS